MTAAIENIIEKLAGVAEQLDDKQSGNTSSGKTHKAFKAETLGPALEVLRSALSDLAKIVELEKTVQ